MLNPSEIERTNHFPESAKCNVMVWEVNKSQHFWWKVGFIAANFNAENCVKKKLQW